MGKSLELKWRGTPGASYKGLEERVIAGARDGLNTIGLVTTNHMKSSLQRGPKSGRVYELYQPRRTHQASAPGEYPATDTGRLAGSIGYEITTAGAYDLSVVMFANAEYAIPLEMKPSSRGGRPFMSRAVDEKQEGYGVILSKAIGAKMK